MAALTSQGALTNSADLTVSSLGLVTAAAFQVTFPNANQFGVIDSVHYISLPANHGGIRVNYIVGSRLDGLGTNPWGLAKIREDWTVEGIDTVGESCRVPAVKVNDPMHGDSAILVSPGPLARLIRVRASAMFRSWNAVNGTVNFQAGLVAAGASVTVQAFSQVEFRLY